MMISSSHGELCLNMIVRGPILIEAIGLRPLLGTRLGEGLANGTDSVTTKVQEIIAPQIQP